MTDHETEQLLYRQLLARLLTQVTPIKPRFSGLDALLKVARHREIKQLTGHQHKSGSWCQMVSYGVIRDIQIDGRRDIK